VCVYVCDLVTLKLPAADTVNNWPAIASTTYRWQTDKVATHKLSIAAAAANDNDIVYYYNNNNNNNASNLLLSTINN